MWFSAFLFLQCKTGIEDSSVEIERQEFTKRIESSLLVSEFDGIEVQPHRLGEDIIITLPNREVVRFNKSTNNFYIEKKAVSDDNELVRLLSTMDSLGIVAMSKKGNVSRYYTSYSDSTYSQIKISNPNYNDIFIRKQDLGKSYNLVFMRVDNSDSASLKQIQKLIEFASAQKIDRNWYLMRSTIYSEF